MVATGQLDGYDPNSERVKAFARAMAEVHSIAKIAEAILDIAYSDAWHDHRIEGHECHWLAAEFDYFLVTCGVRHADMVEVFKGRECAISLAPLLDPNSTEHRPLRVASEDWKPHHNGETLIDMGKRLGWITPRGRARKPPVGRRARARASGASREARAREARRARIGEQRCAELVAIVAALIDESSLSADECRFVADELNLAAAHSDGGMHK
jgi:hypothetical protein